MRAVILAIRCYRCQSVMAVRLDHALPALCSGCGLWFREGMPILEAHLATCALFGMGLSDLDEETDLPVKQEPCTCETIISTDRGLQAGPAFRIRGGGTGAKG